MTPILPPSRLGGETGHKPEGVVPPSERGTPPLVVVPHTGLSSTPVAGRAPTTVSTEVAKVAPPGGLGLSSTAKVGVLSVGPRPTILGVVARPATTVPRTAPRHGASGQEVVPGHDDTTEGLEAPS